MDVLGWACTAAWARADALADAVERLPATFVHRDAFRANLVRRGDELVGYVLGADFVPLPEAAERVERHPYRVMGEPVGAYLRGAVGPGASWRYRRDPDGQLHLVGWTDGTAPGATRAAG